MIVVNVDSRTTSSRAQSRGRSCRRARRYNGLPIHLVPAPKHQLRHAGGAVREAARRRRRRAAGTPAPDRGGEGGRHRPREREEVDGPGSRVVQRGSRAIMPRA